MKRLFSFLLTLVLCLTVLPAMPVGAEDDFTISDGESVWVDHILYTINDGYAFVQNVRPMDEYLVDGKLIIPEEVLGYPVYGVLSFAGSLMDMTEIVFPSTLRALAGLAFDQCPNLERVVLPEGFEMLSNGTFNKCPVLKTVSLPASMNTYYSDPFSGCMALERIDVAEGGSLLMSEDGVLYTAGKKKLLKYPPARQESEVTVPDGVVRIEARAFEENPYLTHITLPDTLRTIGDSAFKRTHLTELTLPDSVSEVGEMAFYETDIETLRLGSGLREIGEECFGHCKKLTEVDFPEGCVTIGNAAFSSCTSLTSFEMPDTVTTAVGGLFSECYSLQTVKLSPNLTSIPGMMFADTQISEIEIPETVTNIGVSPFYRSPLDEKILAQDVYIQDGWLLRYDAAEAESVTVPEGIKGIASGALINCDTAKEIKLPDSLRYVGDYVFSMCESLTSIRIPEGVVSIGERCFEQSEKLEEIILPDSLETIGEYAMSECASLRSLKLPDKIKVVPNGLCNRCYELRELILPAEATIIDQYAFCRCWELGNVTLPETVEIIGANAFAGTEAMTEIVFPESVREIGVSSLQDSGVERITVMNPDAEININWLGLSQYRGLLIGHTDSTLYEFAQQRRARFASLEDDDLDDPNAGTIPPRPPLAGDVNYDDAVSMSDAVILAKIIAEEPDLRHMTGINYRNADFNKDGLVDLRDLHLLLRYLTQIENT